MATPSRLTCIRCRRGATRTPRSSEAARKDILARYSTVEFADVGVVKIEKKSDSHFHLVDESGKDYDFRKIILAVGSAYDFPDIDGYQEAWGSRM